jgi:lipopolysaccharide transport system ATP-binding protein
MNSNIALRVENLGKKYVISHRYASTGYQYVALRDEIARSVRNAGNHLLRLLGRRNEDPGSNRNEDFWALKDVSFDLEQGGRLGIIGRNGAGKSTLLKVLSRITDPTTGRISIQGRVASLLEVGTGFHPELTGRENIFLNGAILGMTKVEIKKRFDDIVSFAEIEQFLDTPVKRYSSGMYVRLAFSVAAHLEPEILIVDEVLAVGDIQFQKKCLGKMAEVGKEGRTVLFVSHNMGAIEQLCNTCLLIEKGRAKRFEKDVRGVVKEYLFGDNPAELTTVWRNTGSEYDNPWFTPLEFSIVDELGVAQRNPIQNDADIQLEVKGEVRQPHDALALQYTIYTEEGILLYHSRSHDTAVTPVADMGKGIHIIRTKVPRRFLNEGSYRIELSVALHKVHWIFRFGGHVPTVFLVIEGGLTDSKHWSAKREGLLAPMFEWKVLE